MKAQQFILGGGVTGLAAGMASGFPVLEAGDSSGGICSSYYMRPGSNERLSRAPADGEVYRFEIGGGHWIFGGDPFVKQFIQDLAPVKAYERLSSVYIPQKDIYVPYPLQNNLSHFDAETVKSILAELGSGEKSYKTMKEWLAVSFGETMGRLFFDPFHELYTAGLYDRIQPQDAYKSPVDLAMVRKGAKKKIQSVGYNVTFLYPQEGLNVLAQRMAKKCDIRYGQRVIKIDAKRREIHCGNGKSYPYKRLISTLPLCHMETLCGIKSGEKPDPYTAVLVLNIGARRGKNCPKDHWIYLPVTKSGFHRIGIYSNVDKSFLPKAYRQKGDAVSIYVERSYIGGKIKPTPKAMHDYGLGVVGELQRMGYIEGCEVMDPTWIEVAYTWSWPGSKWRQAAMRALEVQNIYPVGRYARWTFQGIADSIRDGFIAGSSFKK